MMVTLEQNCVKKIGASMIFFLSRLFLQFSSIMKKIVILSD